MDRLVAAFSPQEFIDIMCAGATENESESQDDDDSEQFTVDVRFILTLWDLVVLGRKLKKSVEVDNCHYEGMDGHSGLKYASFLRS